jgi:hypothetical protein
MESDSLHHGSIKEKNKRLFAGLTAHDKDKLVEVLSKTRQEILELIKTLKTL